MSDMTATQKKNDRFHSELARWYKTFGVYQLLDQLEQPKKPATDSTKQQSVRQPQTIDIKFDSIDALKNFIQDADLCGLKNTARSVVFANGSLKSGLMIIGEAPGADEDIQGEPFVGQSGMLLNNMLASIGLERNDVYVSNILFWRPPGNRTPSTDEIDASMPYVAEHIRLADPKALLLLGGVAAKAILNTASTITSLRGQTNKYKIKNSDKTIDVVPTFHPAYLLRSPGQKANAFIDMLKIKSLTNG